MTCGAGRRRPAYFCFLPSYWLNTADKTPAPRQVDVSDGSLDGLDVDVADEARRVMSGDIPADRHIVLGNLRKNYKRQVAVDGLRLSIPEVSLTSGECGRVDPAAGVCNVKQ